MKPLINYQEISFIQNISNATNMSGFIRYHFRAAIFTILKNDPYKSIIVKFRLDKLHVGKTYCTISGTDNVGII